MELTDRLSTPGSQIPMVQPHSVRAGSVTGLMLLVSLGILPLEVGTNPVTHVRVSENVGTTVVTSIRETVSVTDILHALANVHDNMLAAAVELDETARDILYERLWNLYE